MASQTQQPITQLHKAHPNLFLIIQKLQNIQAANEITFIQYAAGGKRKTRKLKYRNIDSRLDQLKERLQQGEININHYTDVVSHLLKLGWYIMNILILCRLINVSIIIVWLLNLEILIVLVKYIILIVLLKINI